MAKFPMDLSKFKKVSVKDGVATLRHPEGHEIKIAMKAIDPKNHEALHKLPMYDGGGSVDSAWSQQDKSDFEKGATGQSNPTPSPSPTPTAKPSYAQQHRQEEADAAARSKADPGYAAGGQIKQSNPKLEESKKLPPKFADGGAVDKEQDAIQSYNPIDTASDALKAAHDYILNNMTKDTALYHSDPEAWSAKHAMNMAMGTMGGAPKVKSLPFHESAAIEKAAQEAPMPGTTVGEAVDNGVISGAERNAKIADRQTGGQLPNFADGTGDVEQNSSSMPGKDDLHDLPVQNEAQQQISDKMDLLQNMTPGIYAGQPDKLLHDAEDRVVREKQIGAVKEDLEKNQAQSDTLNQVKSDQAYNVNAQKFGLPLRGQPAPQQMASNQQDLGAGQPDDQGDGQQQAGAAPSQPGMQVPSMLSGYNQEVQGINDQAAAEGKLGYQQAEVLKNEAAGKLATQQAYVENYQKLENERQKHMKDIENGHINPDRYWTGYTDTNGQKVDGHSKLAAIFGMILGGFDPKGRPNAASEAIDQGINRSINAQAQNLNSDHNLLAANLHQFGNLHDATAMSRVMLGDVAIAKLQQMAAKSADPMAKARALIQVGKLQQAQAPAFNQLAMSQTLQRANSDGGPIQGDPASYVRFMVPADRRKEVFKEIQDAQNIRRGREEGLAAFDKAAKEQSVFSKNVLPGINSPYIGQLKASVLPMFQNIDGTVRQAAMDAFLPTVTPAAGDTKHTQEVKRDTLDNWYIAHSSAPTAKGFGIDMDKFPSTSTNPEMSLTPQQKSIADHARRNPNDIKSQLWLKKLGLK